MKVVIQRVKDAVLKIENKVECEIGKGLVCFVGFCETDDESNLDFIIKRISGLRVFEVENGKMNLNPEQIGASFMLVSNFTLYGDLKDGFRPSFIKAMRPEIAKPLYYKFVEKFKQKTNLPVVSGVFGADMQITQTNDGPITLILEN